jgi:hypothetical protein
MWEPWRHTTPWASTASYCNSFFLQSEYMIREVEMLVCLHNEVSQHNIWESAALVLLIGRTSGVHYLYGLTRHDVHTKFYEDPLRYWNNIGIISTVWETAVLVLLMGRLCELRRWDALRWHDILSKCNGDWYRRSSCIKILPRHFENQQCCLCPLEGLMKYLYAVEMN